MKTNKEIKEFWKTAYEFAARKGHSSIADDFAQEAVMKRLSSPNRSLEFLLIDFLRKEYGETGEGRSKSGKAKANARLNSIELTELHENIELVSSTKEVIDWRSCVPCTGRLGMICDLKYDRDLDLSEIAEIFNVTETRISQLLKKVDRLITDAVILKDRLPSYKDFPESNLLEVDWITI